MKLQLIMFSYFYLMIRCPELIWNSKIFINYTNFVNEIDLQESRKKLNDSKKFRKVIYIYLIILYCFSHSCLSIQVK